MSDSKRAGKQLKPFSLGRGVKPPIPGGEHHALGGQEERRGEVKRIEAAQIVVESELDGVLDERLVDLDHPKRGPLVRAILESVNPRNLDTSSAPYEAHAGKYARRIDPTLTGPVERLAELAGARPGVQLLDLASGTGAVARAAAHRGASVVGIDIAPKMLALARELSPEIEFRLADAHAIPFQSNRFDAITCGLSVSHFGGREQALQEVLRVLRRGGRFVASAWGEGGATPSSRVASEILARHSPSEPGSTLDEETWMHPESGNKALRSVGFERVSVKTESFAGHFASGDDALAWTLAWPIRAARLARLDARSRDAVLSELRGAVATSDLSWRFVFNFYLAESPRHPA